MSGYTGKDMFKQLEEVMKKCGGQKCHTAHFLNKKDVENKIKNKEFKHEVINIGEPQSEYKGLFTAPFLFILSTFTISIS